MHRQRIDAATSLSSLLQRTELVPLPALPALPSGEQAPAIWFNDAAYSDVQIRSSDGTLFSAHKHVSKRARALCLRRLTLVAFSRLPATRSMLCPASWRLPSSGI